VMGGILTQEKNVQITTVESSTIVVKSWYRKCSEM